MVYLVGLVLRSEEIGAAVEAWPVGLFGLVCINFNFLFIDRFTTALFQNACLDLIDVPVFGLSLFNWRVSWCCFKFMIRLMGPSIMDLFLKGPSMDLSNTIGYSPLQLFLFCSFPSLLLHVVCHLLIFDVISNPTTFQILITCFIA